MKNIHEIRRQNCQLLIKHAGSMAVFAQRIERSQTQVSRFAGINPTRNVGEKLARHIERCFCVSSFWLDVDRSFFDLSMPNVLEKTEQTKHEQLHAILSDILLAIQDDTIDDVTYNQLLEIAKKTKLPKTP
ncbi:hypothetical protein [Thiosulfativibrio zosterae]|uniref:Uncharacterized protein n=1 Tax=Thiosulfativibrio zosterae TaxID=2675053 RepID=A0A6F8PR11_9GAMM|nr:hypothetical protein [Thiosulfativibrio zosterae]BBP44561.1 hypothetical protein THMIRHAT_23070 [Thiosulfativibrio zosterae]